MVMIRLDGKSTDAKDLNPIERTRIIADLKQKAKQAPLMEAAKLRRIIKELESVHKTHTVTKKMIKAATKRPPIEAQSQGIDSETWVGRFNGGHGKATFVQGGAPGKK